MSISSTLFYIGQSIGQQVNNISGGDKVENHVTNALSIAFFVVGVAAVIMIIFGGVQYMLSQGEAPKIKKAKDIILYSVIGLIVAALAFTITRFIALSV